MSPTGQAGLLLSLRCGAQGKLDNAKLTKWLLEFETHPWPTPLTGPVSVVGMQGLTASLSYLRGWKH